MADDKSGQTPSSDNPDRVGPDTVYTTPGVDLGSTKPENEAEKEAQKDAMRDHLPWYEK